MQSKKQRYGAFALLAVAAMILFALIGARYRERLIYVDGVPVSSEEASFHDGDLGRIVRSKVIQAWAGEYGLAEEFSYKRFLQSLEKENGERSETHQSGGVIYGPIEYTPLQYYNRMMGEYERGIQARLISDVRTDTLEAYYDMHRERYRRADQIDAELIIREEGRIVYEGGIHLDKSNYRALTETSETMVSYLLELEDGEACVWQEEDGNEWQLSCTNRVDGGFDPFEEVQGAVSNQYARDIFEEELSRRISGCEIRDER